MGMPSQTGRLFAPHNESGSKALTVWPRLPPPREQHFEGPCLIKYPSFKKPRNSETALNPRIPVAIARSIDRIPYRTQLCNNFRFGNCSYGNHCHFAHAIGDIRKLPPGKQGSWVDTWDENQRVISKMGLCRRFCSGEVCPFGRGCNFVHEGLEKAREDLSMSMSKNMGIKISTTGSGGNCRIGPDPFENTRLGKSSLNAGGVYQKSVWKTRRCTKWEMTSGCPYGERCHFAHGQAELRRLGSHTVSESGTLTVSNPAIPAKDASASRILIGSSYKQQFQGKKCLFKRKGVEQITDIYADWIDDMPLAHSSLGRVGS